MEQAAVKKAASKLDRAQVAAKILRESKSAAEILAAWEDFISAASVFYSALEQGAKTKGSSGGWFGHKKSERRIDPLLRYIHHARNAEQHGLEQIAQQGSSQVTLRGKDTALEVQDAAPGTWKITKVTGDVELANDRVRLTSVHDRGTQYDPPAEHRGKAFDDGTSPAAVADAIVAYLQEILEEARGLSA